MRFLFHLTLGILCFSCNAQPGVRLASDAMPSKKYPADTTITIGGVVIWLQRPADSLDQKKTLLLLPGWDYSNHKWCDSTRVCETALKQGYAVVAPQMGRSIYASQYYPETRQDLRAYPTLTWLDSVLGILQREQKLFLGKNYVLGLSTGGRGVALICEKRPGFFHAAAALSGDYNQFAMPSDRLTTLVYGPYYNFPDRWKHADNPLAAIDTFVTPIYLGHGALDKVVPLSQSVEFYDSLTHRRTHAIVNRNFAASATTKVKSRQHGNNQAKNENPDIQLHIDPNAGHDFSYWRSELPQVFLFFKKH